jgi:beta-phosphoglucomutase-like phosphatase (HAD superfamily)
MYSPAFRRYVQAMTPTCSVLLDLDGTLINSQPGILASCLAALRALGHEADETLDIKRIIGPPLEDIMRVLLQPYGDDRIGEAVAAYRQHYGESGFLGSEPYPALAARLKRCSRPDCEFTWQRRSGKLSRAAFCTIWGLHHTLMAFTVQRRAAGWITSLNCSPIFCRNTTFCSPTV